MRKVIGVMSGKGGVGKSTLAVNLASFLSMRGESVLIIDADFYNPSVCFHLGITPPAAGLQDLLNKRARLENALTMHPMSGLRCIVPSLKIERGEPDCDFCEMVRSLNYDYVVIDCPPGLGLLVEKVIHASDECFLLMTPEIPSCMAAIKLSEMIAQNGKKHAIRYFLNRVTHRSYEFHPREIEEIAGQPLTAIIPEDQNVPISIAAKTPVVLNAPHSPSSRVFGRIAGELFLDAKGGARPHAIGTGSGMLQAIIEFIMRFVR